MSESRRFSEDALAMLVAGTVLSVSMLVTVLESHGVFSSTAATGGGPSWRNPMKSIIVLPTAWEVHPFESGVSWFTGAASAGVLITAVMSAVMWLGRGSRGDFWRACAGVFLLSLLAYVLAEQKVVKYYGLEYALWALVIGLLISNTTGVSKALSAGVRTELYMKTGLVLLGAEVLFGKLLALGLPGICVSWVVTPVVLIVTFWFGQRVLKMESAALNMVISADMSVCGVSAAIATAAACRAKKEELTTAVGISLAFTVMMMVAMPPLIQAMGLGPVVGGAWVGGTIDSTGAVGAAGAMLGKEAEVVATTIKMIQNMLIGVVAFGVAVYWVTCVERTEGARPEISEIWRRFPRFILGFLG
ncbi:MAG: YeiH family protein, partial [Planctomyces sp.]